MASLYCEKLLRIGCSIWRAPSNLSRDIWSRPAGAQGSDSIDTHTHTHTHTHTRARTHTHTQYYNEQLITYVVPDIGLVTVELRGVDELLLYYLFRVFLFRVQGFGCRV